MNVPDKLVNYTIYSESKEILGVAEITLPELSYMTESLKGAGIAGEVDLPVLGHFQSLTLGINWNVIEDNNVQFLAPKTYHFDCRGSSQIFDSGSGSLKTKGIKVIVKAIPKKFSMGKFDVGAKTDTNEEFEVTYLKLWIEGKEYFEIDKMNFICRIAGVDYLEKVRRDLGK